MAEGTVRKGANLEKISMKKQRKGISFLVDYIQITASLTTSECPKDSLTPPQAKDSLR